MNCGSPAAILSAPYKWVLCFFSVNSLLGNIFLSFLPLDCFMSFKYEYPTIWLLKICIVKLLSLYINLLALLNFKLQIFEGTIILRLIQRLRWCLGIEWNGNIKSKTQITYRQWTQGGQQSSIHQSCNWAGMACTSLETLWCFSEQKGQPLQPRDLS